MEGEESRECNRDFVDNEMDNEMSWTLKWSGPARNVAVKSKMLLTVAWCEQ